MIFKYRLQIPAMSQSRTVLSWINQYVFAGHEARGTSFQILNPCKLSINFPIGCRFGFMNFNGEWCELDFEVDEQASGLKEIVWDRVWV